MTLNIEKFHKMMDNSNYNQFIDKYLSGELNEREILQFNERLDSDPEFFEEFIFQKEVIDAVTENELMQLRKNLGKIIRNESQNTKKQTHFDLLKDIPSEDSSKENIDPRIVVNFYSSLPKIHLFHHNILVRENIHSFYKEQFRNRLIEDVQEENADSEEILPDGLKESILESDIMSLRESLRNISANLPKHNYSVEDIEKYNEGLLEGDEKLNFENELIHNQYLAEDVRMQKELDAVIREQDIIALRDQLSLIQNSQASINQKLEFIEEFIDGKLSGDKLELFEQELFENADLNAEVNLHREIDRALTETDVIQLRQNLERISTDLIDKKEKSVLFLPYGLRRAKNLIASAVAVLILVTGVISVLKYIPVSNDHLYSKYYEAYDGNYLSRSATSPEEKLEEAFQNYSKRNYQEALPFFDLLIEEKGNIALHFYKGSCYQALDETQKAIEEYRIVIDDGNNFAVETAEWYLGLCYLKQGNINEFRSQMTAIIERKGYYSKNAKSILRKIKFRSTA